MKLNLTRKTISQFYLHNKTSINHIDECRWSLKCLALKLESIHQQTFSFIDHSDKVSIIHSHARTQTGIHIYTVVKDLWRIVKRPRGALK